MPPLPHLPQVCYHSSMEAFRIENAKVRRDGKIILSVPSLSVGKGEHIAVIGPNGAGKSTLVGIIAHTIYPLASDDYSMTLLGRKRWMISELKLKVSLVSPAEDMFIQSRYTAREIVASGLHASLGFDFHHDVLPEDWEKADEELGKVGILHLKGRTIDTLSTGEKRRVLLARAAITKPELLLLDEASSGLDFPSRADLRNTISSYATGDCTVVMVTHELSEILPSINRVLLMKDGEIVFDGNKKEALTSERLSDLYSRHVAVAEENGIYNAFC